MKAVNQNSQTMLAKLLAKENINVVVGNYNTAFFDIKNRTLGLPTWNSDNKGVADLLVGHEVGHALYTPSDAVERFKKCIPGAPFDIANIVEDIRIERLVRTNYPGLIYSFNEGYKYFIENDFFTIKNLIVGDLKFIDRLNLRGKIGALIQVPMDKNEEAIYSRCLSAETYDEVLDICKDIYDLIKKENKNDKQKQQQQQQDESGDSEEKQVPSPQTDEDESDDQEAGDSKNDQEDKGSSESKDQEKSEDTFNDENDHQEESEDEDESSENGRAHSNDEDDEEDEEDEEESNSGDVDDQLNSKQLDAMRSNTQNEFDNNLQNLQKQIDYHVVNAPTKEQTLQNVVPIEKIMTARQMCSTYQSAMNNPEFVSNFVEFKSKTKKHIAVLIKEFERRKSAFQYSRSRQSDSGSINVNKLHSYKFEDQIFKSVTTLADAKSHGMVFFIDYSGSMRNTLEDVVDQTLQLVYFCKAVGIPFEVYGFTGPDYRNYGSRKYSDIQKQFGLNVVLNERAHVFELLNSTMKKDNFELSVRELKAQIFKFNYNHGNNYNFNMDTMYESMSSTPLLETIIIAHDIVKNFKIKNRIQKMNTIFLTDGDGPKLSFTDFSTDVEREHRKPMIGSKLEGFATRNVNYKMNIHGRTIEFNHKEKQMYCDLIENLKITCGTTVIGFFIGQSQKDVKTTGINSFIYNTNNKNKVSWNEAVALFKTETKKGRKEKCMMISGAYGYDAYFIFDGNKNLNIDDKDTFESETLKEGKSFNDSSSQNKLAREFTKFTSEKRNSRVFLNKFAELIA